MKLLFITLILITMMIDPFSIEIGDAFAEKMSYYFNKPVSFTMRDLLADWWSATLAKGDPYICTNTVYLDTRWYGSTSPLWKYSLVHEWVHTTQGAGCVNNEHSTDLEALSILAEAKEWKAFIAAVNHRLKLNQLTMEEVVNILQ
jgi:hypothetical protein